MKKILISFLGVFLLSTPAWADNVLFKMAAVTTNTPAKTATGENLDLSSYYYYYLGGSALVHNGQTGEATLVYNGVARITHEDGYIKVTLPEGTTIQAGDVIRYTEDTKETTKNILLHKLAGKTAGGRSGAVQVTQDADYTIKSTDVIVGENEFYINLGASLGSGVVNYVKHFTISRPSELVKFYSFEDMTPVDYTDATTEGHEIVADELYLNSDGATEGVKNGIKAISGGKPQSLYTRGQNENRSIKLNVTDPCTVEIWAWSTADKTLKISAGSYSASSATDVLSFTGTDIVKGTYTYTGLEDLKTLYTVVSGGVSVAAIRVNYTKIRPAADLTASTSDVYMRVGDRKSFILTTSSNAAITRSWGTQVGDIGNLNVDETTHTYTFTATSLGDAQMIFDQAATTDYRAATVTVNLHIQDATESVTTIDNTNRAQDGDAEPRALTVDNITIIGDDASATIGGGNNTYVSNSVRYIKDKSYTISVPTNCKIKSVKFTGMSNEAKESDDGNQTFVTINETNSSTFQYVKINNVQQTPTEYTFSGLNASNVTFRIANKYNLLARIELTIAEESSYPLTIANGWASFYCPNDFVQLSEGLTAYYATGYDGEAILLAEVEGQIIRSDRAVVIAGSDGTHTLDVVVNPGNGNFDNFTSALSYTVKRTPLPSGTIYCLNGTIGAFQQYNGEYIPANKAYYRVTTPTSAPPRNIPMRIVQKDNTATSIENTEFIPLDRNAPVYNLQGQQVQITAPGIYVQNGHKYLILQ